MELSLSQAESKYDEYVEMCRNLRDENKLLKDDIEGRSKEQAENIIEIRKGTMQVEYISQLLLFVDNLQGWIQHDLIGGGLLWCRVVSVMCPARPSTFFTTAKSFLPTVFEL